MRYSIFVVIFSLLFGFGGAVLAQEIPLASQEKIDQVPAAATETPANLNKLKKVSQLKKKAETELSKRVDKLGSLSEMMKQKKYNDISKEERTFLEEDIMKNSSAMKDLRDKTRASNDAGELRSILKSMYEDYRILGIVYPRDRGLLAVARNTFLVKKYEQYIDVLTEKEKKLTESGKDTKKLNELVVSMKSHLKESNDHYLLAKEGYQGLIPKDYPAKEKIENARTHNKEGIKHYDMARADYKQAIAENKSIKVVTKAKPKATLSPEELKETTSYYANKMKSAPEVPVAVIKYIEGSGFSPSSLTVKEGTKVVFLETSASLEASNSNTMWVGSDPHPTHTAHPEFDQLKSGNEFSFTFTKKGTWGFHNHLRPNARGTVTVE